MRSIVLKIFNLKSRKLVEKLKNNYDQGIEYTTSEPREIKSIILGISFGLFNKDAFKEILAGDKISFKQLPATAPISR